MESALSDVMNDLHWQNVNNTERHRKADNVNNKIRRQLCLTTLKIFSTSITTTMKMMSMTQ